MFNNLDKEIETLISQRNAVKQQTNNTPQLTGIMIAKPGTEKVALSTTVADFISFTAVGSTGKDKTRYGVAHKDKSILYTGQYVDSNGHPLSIVPKSVFDTMLAILTSTGKQINDLRRELDNTRLIAESQKMTLDALRKNGVID